MNLGCLNNLIKFKDSVKFFKLTQIEKILEIICQTLNVKVIDEFLNFCMTNMRNIDDIYIKLLTIMVTKHISLQEKSIKSIFIIFYTK